MLTFLKKLFRTAAREKPALPFNTPSHTETIHYGPPKHHRKKKATATVGKPVVRSGHNPSRKSSTNPPKVSAPVSVRVVETNRETRVESDNTSSFIAGALIGVAIESAIDSSPSSTDPGSSPGPDFDSGGGGDYSGGGASGDW